MTASEQQPVWVPDADASAITHMHRFAHQVGDFDSYQSLHAWSVDQPESFWSAMADYAGVRFQSPPHAVLTDGNAMPGARWFSGATLNYAEHLLRDADDSPAIIARDETGSELTLTRRQLEARVAAVAAGLRAAGLEPGDRVAAMLPNGVDAVVAMLAAASIGAVFSSCSPDFGIDAVVERFAQIDPRILFVCAEYSYAGKRIDCRDKSARIVAALPSVERVVHAGKFDDFEIAGSEPHYAALPFDHPLFILYSSGTTGKPKCIVHGAGGTLLQHLKEHLLHTDLHPGDVLFYFTTCGWMMWNWLVGALATRAVIMLYDGSPFYPGTDALVSAAARHGVSVFGTSPRYLTALEKAVSSESPNAVAAWSELSCILSTGAPLMPESYDFVQSYFGPEVRLSSISGGTDIISCFMLGNPLLPVYRGELQCAGLGMAVSVYGSDGRPADQCPGELVCTRPFPSMPLGFWRDPEGSRYRAAYFERFPGVWTHGDRVAQTPHGGFVISGRSDAVLNPGGVRIGSAEVVGPALALPELLDAIAVGHQVDGDEEVVLFVVLTDGLSLDDALQEHIRAAIRAAASPRHVPAHIHAVPEIPRTLSGKAVELAVRAVIHGDELGNREALANPGALDYFRGYFRGTL